MRPLWRKGYRSSSACFLEKSWQKEIIYSVFHTHFNGCGITDISSYQHDKYFFQFQLDGSYYGDCCRRTRVKHTHRFAITCRKFLPCLFTTVSA